MADCPMLQSHLQAWRTEAHALDNLRSVRPITFICDDKSIVKLATIRSNKVTCVLDIVRALDETEEWGGEFGRAVYNVICAYDSDKSLNTGDNSEQSSEAEEEDEEAEEAAENESSWIGSEDGASNSDSSEEEEIIPHKRARMAPKLSRVPVLVSITNILR
jgi:hypothetical protein